MNLGDWLSKLAEVLRTWPDIIVAASTPLGMLALMVLALALVALYFFPPRRPSWERLPVFVLLLFAACLYGYAVLRLPASLAREQVYSGRKEVYLSELPEAWRTPMSAELSGRHLAHALSEKGSLRLVGTDLVVDAIGASASRTLSVYGVTLEKGARIILNGNTLNLQAARIVPGEGSVVSFRAEDATAPPGKVGHDGGEFVLSAVPHVDGVLSVDLSGQRGGKGESGDPGTDGRAGSRGDNAAEGLFDCARGGGNGGNGENGGPGHDGVPGKAGGDGGRLVVPDGGGELTRHILFRSTGGGGGEGGDGGHGGRGGARGEGGSGSTRCGGGNPGVAGNNGPPGARGTSGPEGRSTTTVATLSSAAIAKR